MRKFNGVKAVVLGGIFLALTVLILYLESLLPTAKLSLYAFSSFFVAFIIIESGIKMGWIFYIASSLLVLIVIPDKTGPVPYFIFFGSYGIVKYYAEKLKFRIAEYIVKLSFFNICLVLALLFIKALLFNNLNNIKIPLQVFIILLQGVFLVYDYAYSLVVHYYNTTISRRL